MKFIRRYLLSYFFIGFLFISKAQVDFITNGSFEDTVVCSSIVANQFVAANWWMSNTVDYYNKYNLSCGAGGGGGKNVPNNFAGHQYPHSGNAYTGLMTYEATTGFKYYREWLQEKLSDTLVSGKTYCISFWYNEANRTKYAIDRLGIFFSLSGINLSASTFVQYNPQITTPVGQYLNDTLNWNKFSTSYTATGGELYLTFGNFFDSVQTNLQLYPNNPSLYAYSYYLLDDISIIPSDLPPWAGKDTSTCKGDSIYIGRPPEIGLDNAWTNFQGTNVGTGAGVWIKPDTTTTYIVTQDLCGTITKDTVKVIVNCTGVQQYDKNNLINIYPNPASEFLTIEYSIKNGELRIIDILGNEIKREKFSEKAKIDINGLNSGIYFIQLKSNRKIYTSKFIKE